MLYNAPILFDGGMHAAMDEQLTQLVVNDLARHRSRNEIIRLVCEQSSMNWPEAEQFVQKVEGEQAHTIARKQSPLMIFLSIGSFLIGAALSAYGAEFFIAFFNGSPLSALLSLRSAYLRLVGSLTGLGMVIGGLIGLYNTFARYFET